MEKEYPRVLIISPCFLNDVSNETSITMNSYFNVWPKNNIAQIITGQFNIPGRGVSETNNNTFVLNNKDVKLLRLLFSVNREPKRKASHQKLPVIPKNISLKLKFKLLIKQSITSLLDFFKYNFSDELMLFITHFSPDIIYFLPSGYRSIKLVKDISNKFNVKYVPHFMDDWPSTKYNTLTTKLQHKFMSFYIKKSLAKASACLCISDYMCREYEKRYNLEKCYSLMNSVDRFYGDDIRILDKGKKLMKIIYLGGINNQRAEIINQVYNAIKDSDFSSFELIIYTSKTMWEDNKSLYSDHTNIKYGGYIGRNEVFNKIVNCDVLLHVESFDEQMRKYTQYSMSSKIPEYLSTGNIILAVGPPEIASIKYLNDNNAAIIISDLNNRSLIDKQINKLFNTNCSEEFFANARKLFVKNHLKDNQIILPLFRKITSA